MGAWEDGVERIDEGERGGYRVKVISIETWVSSSQYWLLVCFLNNQSVIHFYCNTSSWRQLNKEYRVFREFIKVLDDKWFVKSKFTRFYQCFIRFFLITRFYPSLREFYQCFIWFYPKFLMLYHCFLTENKYYLLLYLIFIVLGLWLPPGSWMLPGFPLVSGYTGFPFSVLPSGFLTLEREVPETKTMFITGKNVNI